jgi:NTE family protein
MINKPKTIILSSGGILVLAHVGALITLDSHKLLSNVTKWGGVSGGALIATCIALGYTLKEILEICERFDFQVLQKIDEDSPFTFMNTLGLDKGDTLTKFINALFTVRGWSPNITFNDLYSERKSNIIIWAADIDTGSLIEFSINKTPNISIAFALHASIQIPIIYPPLLYSESGHLLVDGALIHSMPLDELCMNEQNECLGILCRSQPPQPCPRDVIGYVKHIISVGMDSRSKMILKQFEGKVIHIILPSNFSGTNFNLSLEQKKQLLDAGSAAATEWYNSKIHQIEQKQQFRIKRRHSI